jgi:hypothetical protein
MSISGHLPKKRICYIFQRTCDDVQRSGYDEKNTFWKMTLLSFKVVYIKILFYERVLKQEIQILNLSTQLQNRRTLRFVPRQNSLNKIFSSSILVGIEVSSRPENV